VSARTLVWLRHEQSGRRVPVEVPTVFGRSDAYYRYGPDDLRPERFSDEVAADLEVLNYVKLCSDAEASRVHGLLDPALPGLRDLNSTNGTFLNGERLPADPGGAGPIVGLRSRDRIRIGDQVFEVVVADVSEHEVRCRAEARRVALVAAGPEQVARGQALATFLRERKGITVLTALDWKQSIAALFHLQERADPLGLAAVVVVGEVRGLDVLLGGEPLSFGKLLPLIAGVPGRKLVGLEADGDPGLLERRFAEQAREDAALLTAPAGAARLDEPFMGSLQTSMLDQMRASVSGEGHLAGKLDTVADGLDAMIPPASNILRVDWVDGYDGALRVVFGGVRHADDHALSHSLRGGSSVFRF